MTATLDQLRRLVTDLRIGGPVCYAEGMIEASDMLGAIRHQLEKKIEVREAMTRGRLVVTGQGDYAHEPEFARQLRESVERAKVGTVLDQEA